jgi:hypothetical protein
MNNDLQAQADALRSHMELTPPREPGEKLRAADEAKILELHAQGASQTDIARAVGCHQSTVSRTLAEYDDSRPLARKYLKSKALEMTKRLVTDAKPETILRVLAKLDVVRDDGDSVGEDEGPQCFFFSRIVLNTHDGGTLSPSEVLTPEHEIVLTTLFQPPRFDGLPLEPMLMVTRRGSRAMSPLPCDISEIPSFVKITPDAAKYIREQCRPAIEATVVASEAGNPAV